MFRPSPIGPMVLGNMEIGVNTANLTGIVIVFFLAFVNMFGVKLGAMIQNVFTSAKALSLAALVLLAFTVGRNATAMAANFGAGWSEFWRNAGWSSLHPVQVGIGGPIVFVNLLVILAVVQVGSLFSADAWNNITFTAGEVKNPRRNIPLSLIMGTGFVLTVYFLASLGYMMVLPMHGDPHGATALARGVQYASEDRVGTAALEQIFHSGGAYLMAAAILVSTFGCANGLSLAGARVYYAMSQDGLFFKSVGKLSEKYKTPSAGLFVQACWTALLCVSGSYSQLLDYIIFAVLVFYILTIVGLFVLRVKQPNASRPYKALGYPVLPALYIVMASWICIVLLRYKPQYTWPGLVLVLAGNPGLSLLVAAVCNPERRNNEPYLKSPWRMSLTHAKFATNQTDVDAHRRGRRAGRTHAQAVAGRAQPGHARYWSSHRRRHLHAHRPGCRAACRTCRCAELCALRG